MDRISFMAIDYSTVNLRQSRKEFKIFSTYTENYNRASLVSSSKDNSVAAIYSEEVPGRITVVTRDAIEPLERVNERVDESIYYLELSKFPMPKSLKQKRILAIHVDYISRFERFASLLDHNRSTEFEQDYE